MVIVLKEIHSYKNTLDLILHQLNINQTLHLQWALHLYFHFLNHKYKTLHVIKKIKIVELIIVQIVISININCLVIVLDIFNKETIVHRFLLLILMKLHVKQRIKYNLISKFFIYLELKAFLLQLTDLCHMVIGALIRGSVNIKLITRILCMLHLIYLVKVQNCLIINFRVLSLSNFTI